jgi:hypothetical protein
VYSIRKRIRGVLMAGWACGLGLAGCQLQQKTPGPEPLNDTPIKTDQAMEIRQWTPSPSLYQNDSVIAWPDFAPLQSVALPYPLDFFTEPALFVGNTFYFPAGIFVEPIWKEQTYKSLSAPASYTLMPPLAAGPEPTPR